MAMGLIQGLTHNGCVVGIYNLGGKCRLQENACVPLQPQQSDIPPLEACHVALIMIVPPLHQVQLLAIVQRRANDTMDCEGMAEPSAKFAC